jgi:hypothetical protein
MLIVAGCWKIDATSTATEGAHRYPLLENRRDSDAHGRRSSLPAAGKSTRLRRPLKVLIVAGCWKIDATRTPTEGVRRVRLLENQRGSDAH